MRLIFISFVPYHHFSFIHRHNLGLAHSNEGNEYQDRSGMMGISYGQDNGPLMCFNAAKSWQLGWNLDRRVTYEYTQPNSASYRLIGQSDIAIASDKTLLKVCQITQELFYACITLRHLTHSNFFFISK